MLRKILPHPFLTLALIVVWQMLVNKLTFGNLVLGTILGLIIPVITSPYWPNRPRLSSLPRIVEYVLIVLWDICVANVQVAMIILFKTNANTKPAWISIPLELRTPEAITVLAGTITMTPARCRAICRRMAAACLCIVWMRLTRMRCAMTSRRAMNAGSWRFSNDRIHALFRLWLFRAGIAAQHIPGDQLAHRG